MKDTQPTLDNSPKKEISESKRKAEREVFLRLMKMDAEKKLNRKLTVEEFIPMVGQYLEHMKKKAKSRN